MRVSPSVRPLWSKSLNFTWGPVVGTTRWIAPLFLGADASPACARPTPTVAAAATATIAAIANTRLLIVPSSFRPAAASHTNLFRPKWIGSSRPYRALAAPARDSGDPEGCVTITWRRKASALRLQPSGQGRTRCLRRSSCSLGRRLMPTHALDPAHVGRQSGDGPFAAWLGRTAVYQSRYRRSVGAWSSRTVGSTMGFAGR